MNTKSDTLTTTERPQSPAVSAGSKMYKCWRISSCPTRASRSGWKPRNSAFFSFTYMYPMTRRKIDPSEKLDHKITIRVSTPFLNKMNEWLQVSNANSLAELARMIVYKEEIIWYHKNEASDTLAVEMTAIRQELHRIGHNINQVTRYFNGTTIPAQKIFEALKILDEYQKVKIVVDQLTILINQINNGRKSD